MMAMTLSKAAAGDPEAIKTLEMLRSIGLIKEEPEVKKELAVWEILDMAMQGRRERRKRWLQESTLKGAS